MNSDRAVTALAVTPALPNVATDPATTTLPAVAIDPATAVLAAVAIDPATAVLAAVAIDPATAVLPLVASDRVTDGCPITTATAANLSRPCPGSPSALSPFGPGYSRPRRWRAILVRFCVAN